MSGLDDVLAGRTPSGVYRWDTAYDIADVRHTVEHAGSRFTYVDGWTYGSKVGFLIAVGEALDFPDYYGRNLDALNDCLWDLQVTTVLLWDGWSTLARADEPTFSVIVEIFDSWREKLTVLLPGDGPESNLPSLA